MPMNTISFWIRSVSNHAVGSFKAKCTPVKAEVHEISKLRTSGDFSYFLAELCNPAGS